jgi:hypothetical protein
VTCHCSGEDSTDTAPTLATSGPFFLIHSGYVTLRQRGEIPTTSMTDAPPAHDRAVEATCTGARPSDPTEARPSPRSLPRARTSSCRVAERSEVLAAGCSLRPPGDEGARPVHRVCPCRSRTRVTTVRSSPPSP